MTARSVRLSAVSLMLLFSAACQDESGPFGPPNMQVVGRGEDVPPRGNEALHLRHWGRETAEALWAEAAETDTVFTVGLKLPGHNRGVYKGRRLIDKQSENMYRGLLRNEQRVQLHAIDSMFPQVRVKVRDISTLQRIRSLPYVDFVEPTLVRVIYADGFGCGHDPYNDSLRQVGLGDVISPKFQWMKIDKAWTYTQGAGVTIGLTDTGVDYASWSEFNWDTFRTGWSAGRWIMHHSVLDWNVECDHGTNMAGILAAPMNGTHVVGVAYKSNLASVHQANGVVANPSDAASAIDYVVQTAHSKVVNMSWGTIAWYESISDRITWYTQPYHQDVVFIAAAGTGCFPNCDVVFPGTMSDVFTVSATTPYGQREPDANHGPDVDATAYVNLPTTSLMTVAIENSSGTSAATAVVSGIAALVRAAYPGWNSYQVRAHLEATAGTACGMPAAWRPLINAFAAVGGLCIPPIAGDEIVQSSLPSQTRTYTASVSGGRGTKTFAWYDATTGALLTTGTSLTLDFPRGTYTRMFYVQVTDWFDGMIDRSQTKVVYVSTVPFSSVMIYGPSEITRQPGHTCAWTAQPTGGVGPYYYKWSVNGIVELEGQDQSYFSRVSNGYYFRIELEVRDALNEIRFWAHDVGVNKTMTGCGNSPI